MTTVYSSPITALWDLILYSYARISPAFAFFDVLLFFSRFSRSLAPCCINIPMCQCEAKPTIAPHHNANYPTESYTYDISLCENRYTLVQHAVHTMSCKERISESQLPESSVLTESLLVRHTSNQKSSLSTHPSYCIIFSSQIHF